jgi:hypothetical protein
MPKVLLFVPCEKVIVDRDNTLSLISVLETITINIPRSEQANLPKGAAVPLRWYALSLWRREPEDEGRRYEQRTRFVRDGDDLLPVNVQPIPFLVAYKTFRNVVTLNGFPIVPEGECLIRLAIREAGQGIWREVAEYPIYVSRPA